MQAPTQDIDDNGFLQVGKYRYKCFASLFMPSGLLSLLDVLNLLCHLELSRWRDCDMMGSVQYLVWYEGVSSALYGPADCSY